METIDGPGRTPELGRCSRKTHSGRGTADGGYPRRGLRGGENGRRGVASDHVGR
jgi:hypothetical protein